MPPPHVYLSTLSLRRPLAAGAMKVADLPAIAADAGFDGLEISDRQLDRADDLAALRRADFPLVIDVSVDLTLADAERRREELDHAKRWISTAAETGAGIVRLAIGGQGVSVQGLLGRRGGRAGASAVNNPDGRDMPRRRWLQAAWIGNTAHLLRRYVPTRLADAEGKRKRAVESLCTLAVAADEVGVRLAVENHWGITTDPTMLALILDEVGSEHVGSCPDFANFPARIDRYAGVSTLAPTALHVHARASGFATNGEERHIDYARCLVILRDAGYRGAFAVEFTGGGDPLAGCRSTRDLIRRHGDASSS